MLYKLLAAKKPAIRRNYVRYKASGASPAKRAVYLFRLNFSYYIKGDHALKKFSEPHTEPYRKAPESSLGFSEAPKAFAEKLLQFDAISFDIFDTLIYRPFSAPTDLFHIAGAKAEILNFAEVRQRAERECREEKFSRRGTREISFDEIYRYMENNCGKIYSEAKNYELEAEYELCFANPYMKKVWDILREKGKRLIIISDMYLSSEFLEKLLEKNGFSGFEKIFVSNEYNSSKYDGELYKIARDYLKSDKIAHVGDNEQSDIKSALNKGFTPFPVKAPNSIGNKYRPFSMSAIVGSAYRGIVNSHLHNGANSFSQLYEYGFVYSGIFSLGYCNFIHKLKREQNADKILFLARDGDLLRKIYAKLYPDEDTEYFYWSRFAAVKLSFFENPLDFVRRFVYHKSNGKKTAGQLFREMEQESMLADFPEGDVIIDEKNYRSLIDYILKNIDKFAENYRSQTIGAEKYFRGIFADCKKALVVDVGWAGSGGNSIAHLAKRWNLNVEIINAVACTNDSFSEQPNASEALLQSGKMFSYCFSQAKNRELYLKHDSAEGDNMFFEMLLGSRDKSLKCFDESGAPVFLDDENDGSEIAPYIHKGAEDFVSLYLKSFEKYPFMLDISGSDAYAPFALAIDGGRKYFKAVLGGRSFNPNVGGKADKAEKSLDG